MTISNRRNESDRITGMDSRELEPVEGQPLPLAAASENPPLVVDLPEGQKLVVGNLDPGTVIEVATWRGTGRPDSRTNRLMLGVSTNEDEDMPRSRSLPPVEKVQEVEQPAQGYAQPIAQSVPSERTGVIYSNLNPTRDAGQLAKVEPKAKKNKNILKRVLIASGSVSTVGVIAFVLFGVLGLQFAHPAAGLGTSMGAANTSVVLIKPDAELVVGKSVLTDLPNTNENPTVAVVAAVNEKAVLLATDSGYAQVRPELVRGTVIMLLPFLGAVANLVGN
jgi:hypothetical protein